MEKHYNTAYLENTAKAIGAIKVLSYEPFKSLSKGTIVDLGCGNGADAARIHENTTQNVEIIGLDHDAQFIAEAIKKYPHIKFLEADVEKLPFENQSLDGIRTERMFQHLKKPEHVLQEIRRVLKKNSDLIILDTDWPGINFHTPLISIENKIRAYLTDKKVNFGLSARYLPTMVLDHQFSIKKCTYHKVSMVSINELNGLIQYSDLMKEMETKNILTQLEKDSFSKELTKRDLNGTLNCSIDMIYIHAQ